MTADLPELPGVEQKFCPTCPSDEAWWPADGEFWTVIRSPERTGYSRYRTVTGEPRSYPSHRPARIYLAAHCRACSAR